MFAVFSTKKYIKGLSHGNLADEKVSIKKKASRMYQDSRKDTMKASQ